MNISPHEKIIDEEKFLESHKNAIKRYGDSIIGKTYKDRLEAYERIKQSQISRSSKATKSNGELPNS